eukprot:TRINITY_DN8798_c0_g1_i1.p1 TRINITY_DN8798_c0_g1~~TRINITY_DN8798_c0_g1_i1.p1  ORF type:complete len:542 (+),score=115.89 TRINITY_DN8798_c0_g1_i1:144-1769(+)
MSMCPREEQLRRQEQNRLHPLERLPQNVQADNKGLPRVDPSQAVKEYSRPAADKPKPCPSELRPSSVLLSSARHLYNIAQDQAVVDGQLRSAKLASCYAFLSDRLRALRQDMLIQGLRNDDVITCLEITVRVHLICRYTLRRASPDVLDPALCRQQLKESLLILRSNYNHRRQAQGLEADATLHSPQKPKANNNDEQVLGNEALFQAILFVLFYDMPSVAQHVRKLPSNVQRQPVLQLAIKAMQACTQNNFIRFFRIVRKAPLELALALYQHADNLRTTAVVIMHSAFASPNCAIPLTQLVSALALDTPAHAQDLCASMGVEVGDGSIKFRKGSLPTPTTTWQATQNQELLQCRLVQHCARASLPPLNMPASANLRELLERRLAGGPVEGDRLDKIDQGCLTNPSHAKQDIAGLLGSLNTLQRAQAAMSVIHDLLVQHVVDLDFRATYLRCLQAEYNACMQSQTKQSPGKLEALAYSLIYTFGHYGSDGQPLLPLHKPCFDVMLIMHKQGIALFNLHPIVQQHRSWLARGPGGPMLTKLGL